MVLKFTAALCSISTPRVGPPVGEDFLARNARRTGDWECWPASSAGVLVEFIQVDAAMQGYSVNGVLQVRFDNCLGARTSRCSSLLANRALARCRALTHVIRVRTWRVEQAAQEGSLKIRPSYDHSQRTEESLLKHCETYRIHAKRGRFGLNRAGRSGRISG